MSEQTNSIRPANPRALRLDLVDQGQVFVALGILDLINADRRDRAQLPVLDPPTARYTRTASSSISGEANASSSANASSVPGSQSRMIGVGTAISLPVAGQDATLRHGAERRMSTQYFSIAAGDGSGADGPQAVTVPLNRKSWRRHRPSAYAGCAGTWSHRCVRCAR
jgi:hypothetical protein